MQINNAKDWWEVLDNHWSEIFDILSYHLDMESLAYEQLGDASSSVITKRKLASELIYLKENKDGHKLARYFNAVWYMALESYAWSVPGWGELCDLCSEEWALDE